MDFRGNPHRGPNTRRLYLTILLDKRIYRFLTSFFFRQFINGIQDLSYLIVFGFTLGYMIPLLVSLLRQKWTDTNGGGHNWSRSRSLCFRKILILHLAISTQELSGSFVRTPDLRGVIYGSTSTLMSRRMKCDY